MSIYADWNWIRVFSRILGQNSTKFLANAGLLFHFISDLTPQNFDAVIQTNVKALLFATKRVIEMMTKNSVPGHILNISR